MDMSPFQQWKLWLMDLTSLGKDALHVYVGLAIFLGVAALLRVKLHDPRPLAAVLLAVIAGEIWDIYDTLAGGNRLRLAGNIKDVWNTLFWPAVLFALSRWTRVLRK